MIRRSIVLLFPFVFASFTDQALPARGWTRIENCRFLENPANDGDSFHVVANRRKRILRLYFVDCPETSDHNKALKARIAEQAKEFGLATSEVMDIGKQAAKFTSSLLQKANTFTVITRWEDAKGDSDKKRNYAYVLVNGRGLDEQLVEAGLARVYGRQIDIPEHVFPPRGLNGYKHQRHLLSVQKEAKRNRRGAWKRAF